MAWSHCIGSLDPANGILKVQYQPRVVNFGVRNLWWLAFVQLSWELDLLVYAKWLSPRLLELLQTMRRFEDECVARKRVFSQIFQIMWKRYIHASENSFKSTFEILTLIYFILGLKVSFNSMDNKYLQNCISLKVINTFFIILLLYFF